MRDEIHTCLKAEKLSKPQNNVVQAMKQSDWLILVIAIWTNLKVLKSNFLVGSRYNVIEKI